MLKRHGLAKHHIGNGTWERGSPHGTNCTRRLATTAPCIGTASAGGKAYRLGVGKAIARQAADLQCLGAHRTDCHGRRSGIGQASRARGTAMAGPPLDAGPPPASSPSPVTTPISWGY